MPTKAATTPVMLARINGRTGGQLRGVCPSIRWHRLLAQSEAVSCVQFIGQCAPAGVNYFTHPAPSVSRS